ncbi:MAG: hypothetical protein ACM3WV_00515 [Bacillota bacterium]
MEGLSLITYKGKTIVYVDYSIPGKLKSKEKTIALIQSGTDTFKKFPLRSVLAIINAESFFFDMDVVSVFRKSQNECEAYEKKVAVIGVSGLIKVAYNFIVGLTMNTKFRIFNTELEAKEWLVKD